MKIKVDEIVNLLKKEIQSFEKSTDLTEYGELISVGDGIARIYGLENVMSNEMVEFDNSSE